MEHKRSVVRFCGAIFCAAILLLAGSRYVGLLCIRNDSNDISNFHTIIKSGSNIWRQVAETYYYQDNIYKKLLLLLLLVGLWFLIQLLKKINPKSVRALLRRLRHIRKRRKELTDPLGPYAKSFCKATQYGVLPSASRGYTILMKVKIRDRRYVYCAEASDKAPVMEMKGLFMFRTDGVLCRLSLPLSLIWVKDGVSLCGDTFRVKAEDRATSCTTLRAGDKITVVVDDAATITLYVL